MSLVSCFTGVKLVSMNERSAGSLLLENLARGFLDRLNPTTSRMGDSRVRLRCRFSVELAPRLI